MPRRSRSGRRTGPRRHLSSRAVAAPPLAAAVFASEPPVQRGSHTLNRVPSSSDDVTSCCCHWSRRSWERSRRTCSSSVLRCSAARASSAVARARRSSSRSCISTVPSASASAGRGSSTPPLDSTSRVWPSLIRSTRLAR